MFFEFFFCFGVNLEKMMKKFDELMVLKILVVGSEIGDDLCFEGDCFFFLRLLLLSCNNSFIVLVLNWRF